MMEALAKARAEFGPIRRSKTVNVRTKSGGTYTFSYAPLEAILAAVTPALSKYGIAMTQTIREGSVITTLYLGVDQSGNTGAIDLAPVPVGLRDDMTPQERGSAVSYARRYSLTLALCISADDDDDGNAASGNAAQTIHDGVEILGTVGGKGVPIMGGQSRNHPAEVSKETADLLDRAADFASGGLEAYRQFYTKLTQEQRKAIGPQRHADFKLLAEGVDSAREKA